MNQAYILQEETEKDRRSSHRPETAVAHDIEAFFAILCTEKSIY